MEIQYNKTKLNYFHLQRGMWYKLFDNLDNTIEIHNMTDSYTKIYCENQ